MGRIRNITLCVVLFAFAGLLRAQADDSAVFISLSGNIFKNKTLTKGRYLVQNNLRVAKEATLTIEAGSEILFNPGTEIEIVGGFDIQGKPGKPVYFYSLNNSEEGVGITIVGENSTVSVNINYAHFTSLIRPVSFDKKWYRNSVTISNCQFRNINNNDNAIVIGEAEYLKNKAVVPFNFTDNVFADNYSGIYIQNLTSQNVALNFSNNILYNNSFFDYKPRAKDNPISGEANNDKNLVIKFENNVIMNNYVFHDDMDTLIDFAGFGLEGTIAQLDMPGNYWGPDITEATINKYIYGFNKDKFSPIVNALPIVQTPPKNVRSFINKVIVAGQNFNPYLPVTDAIGKEITIEFSKPVAAAQQPRLYAVYLDTSIGKIFTQPVTDFTFSYTAQSKTAKLVIDKVAGLEHAFYLMLAGITDNEGFELPAWNFGKIYLNKIYGQYKNNRKIDLELFFANAAIWKQVPPEGEIETVDPELKKLERKKRTFEIGIMNGVTNYFGDLTTNEFNREEINYIGGLRFRYNFHRRFSFRSKLNYGHLSGNDRYSSDVLRRERGLSFRSVLCDLSAEIEYHLNHYTFSDRNRFIPSISTGINVFYFNPKARYNGKWYALQPIGTEGQTSMPGLHKYSRVQLGLPISASLKTMVGYHFIAEIEVNYVKTFTDYLDDVSNQYPDISAITKNYPGEEEAIANLIDPSGKYRQGKMRGNPKNKDWYLMVGVTFMYRF